MLTTEGRAIIYRETPLPLGLRLFILLIGLSVGIGVPLPFVVHAAWGTPDPVLLLAIVFILAPLAFGGFLVACALWSASDVRLDPEAGRAERTLRGPIVNRHESFPLGDVAVSEVVMRDSDDGPWPLLRLLLPRGRKLDITCFTSRDEAEAWRARIAATLGA